MAVASCRSDGAGMADYDGRGINRISLEARGDIEGLEAGRDERGVVEVYIAIQMIQAFHVNARRTLGVDYKW